MPDLKTLFQRPSVPVVNQPKEPETPKPAPVSASAVTNTVPEPGGQDAQPGELPDGALGPFIGMFQGNSQNNSWNLVEIHILGDKVIRRELRNPLDGDKKPSSMSKTAAFEAFRVLAVNLFWLGGRKVKDLLTSPVEGKK